jgi:hypothetical protein
MASFVVVGLMLVAAFAAVRAAVHETRQRFAYAETVFVAGAQVDSSLAIAVHGLQQDRDEDRMSIAELSRRLKIRPRPIVKQVIVVDSRYQMDAALKAQERATKRNQEEEW